MLGNIVAVNTVMIDSRHVSEANTTEFSATVENIRVAGRHVFIYLEELGESPIISNTGDLSDTGDFSHLQNGQTVYFRTEDRLLERLEELSLISIVSLRTEAMEIVSLSSYNARLLESRVGLTKVGITFSLIFLSLAIYFAVRLKRERLYFISEI